MRILVTAFLACLFFALPAAASSPSYEVLAKLPVVRFGEPVPATDYILLFPAGKPITISFTVEGSLFSKSAETKLTVTPSREIYVYRSWASLDGLVWMPRADLIKSDVIVKVPGYNHPAPGVLKVQMDLPGGK